MSNRSRSILVSLLVSIPVILCTASMVYGQVPLNLQYRGVLTTPDGIPIDCADPLTCTAPPSITVRIYSDPDADIAPIYEEVHAEVFLHNGIFDLVF